jgi:hypothetical protein
MNRYKITSILVILCAAMTVVPPFHVQTEASEQQRGSFPGCQKECLQRHTEAVGKLEEQYKKTHNGMAFQDDIEKTVSEYSSCVENCRQPFSVK